MTARALVPWHRVLRCLFGWHAWRWENARRSGRWCCAHCGTLRDVDEWVRIP